MAELLSSLPGDIPGLLLRGSPIVYIGPDRRRRGWIGLIEHVHVDGRARIAWNAGVHGVERLEHVVIDLTNSTGLAHAAWWVAERIEATQAGARGALTGLEFRVWTDATQKRSMTALAIDTLARLVLRLAGRE